MPTEKEVDMFLSGYSKEVYDLAGKLRKLLFKVLPGIIEQVDLPARMIAYCYGQRYVDMVCTIIPSKKGLKLGFAWGASLPDPDGMLKGSGKISATWKFRRKKIFFLLLCKSCCAVLWTYTAKRQIQMICSLT